MIPPSFDPSSDTLTELAKQRNHLAAERTLLSWINPCLTLLALGIAIDRIFATLSKAFLNADRRLTGQLAYIIGLSTIALGLCLLLLAVCQYVISTRSIQREDYLSASSRPLILAAATAIVLLGILSAVLMLFRSL